MLTRKRFGGIWTANLAISASLSIGQRRRFPMRYEALCGRRKAAPGKDSALSMLKRPGTERRGNTMGQYAWAIVVIAGVFETGFSIGLKYSEGFTRLWPSVATGIMIVLSL